MKVKIINNSENPMPAYQTEGSAGMDLYANSDATIQPQETIFIPTGVHIELPTGYEAQVRPRSGLSKKGILAYFGTIDNDYRGDIGIVITNLTHKPFLVASGDRIAQLVIAKYERVEWEQVTELSDTVRGTGGFGSTGL